MLPDNASARRPVFNEWVNGPLQGISRAPSTVAFDSDCRRFFARIEFGPVGMPCPRWKMISHDLCFCAHPQGSARSTLPSLSDRVPGVYWLTKEFAEKSGSGSRSPRRAKIRAERESQPEAARRDALEGAGKVGLSPLDRQTTQEFAILARNPSPPGEAKPVLGTRFGVAVFRKGWAP